MKTTSDFLNMRIGLLSTIAWVSLAIFAPQNAHAGQANITFTTPAGWSDKLVLSNGTGTNVDSAISTTDTVYLDFAFTNNGTADVAASFTVKIFINGVQFGLPLTQATLTQGQVVKIEDINLGTLALGAPVIRIELDSPTASNGVIAETNEADNSYSRNINVTAPKPVISSLLIDTATEGISYYYRITASNNPTSYSTSTLPAGLSLNPSTGEITGTPAPATVGSFTVNLAATNLNGSGSAVLSLTILARVPHITSPGSATGTIGRNFSYSITALGTPTITFTTLNLPAGLILDGSLIYGKPTQGGNVKVALTATNTAGSETVDLDLTIISPPVVTSLLVKAANIGAAFSYTITATQNPEVFAATVIEANGVTVSVPLTPVPDVTYGFAINRSTGIVSGTPLVGGQFVVRVRAGGTTLTRPMTGTVTTTGTAVAWSGAGDTTRFLTELVVGDRISINGQIRDIASITDNQNLVVTNAFSPNLTAVAPFTSLYGTARLVIGVANIANTPAVTSPLVAGATESDAFAYGIVATNNPTSFSATIISGPAGPTYPIVLGSVADAVTGLELNTLTGIISGVAPQSAASATPYVIRMKGINATGTSSNNADLSLTISLALPRVTSSLKVLYLGSAQYQITGIYTDPAIYSPVTYSAVGLPGFLSLDVNSGVISSIGINTVGAYPITLQITNNRGAGPTAILVITINDPAGPVFTNVDSVVAIPGYAFTFDLVATGSVGFIEAAPTVLNNANLLLTLNASGRISGTIPVGAVPGNYYPIFYAFTDVGDASAFRLTIQVVSGLPINGPIISSSLLASNTAGLTFNYDVTIAATPVPNVPIYLAAYPLSQGVAMTDDTLNVPSDTGLITGIPIQAGTTFVSTTAQNPSGSDTTNIAFTINNITITSPLTAAGTIGQTFTPYQITATGVPIRYGASGLPAGLSVNRNTGAITGIPAETIPTGTSVAYDVVLSASNAFVTGTRTIVFTIAAAPAGSPVITSTLSAFADDGLPFSYQITTTGGPIIGYGATGLPSGFTLDNDPLSATYGLISGTSSQLGLYSVVVTATNAIGADAKVLNITIRPVPPIITSPLNQSVILGVVGIALDTTISTTGSVPITFSLQGGSASLPPGLALSSNHILGTPTTAGDYAIIINATNAAASVSSAVSYRIQQAPKMVNPGALSGVIGDNFTYTPTATGTVPITFTFAGNIPPGLSVVNGSSLQGIPNAGGTYIVTVTASNPPLTPDSLDVTIVIRDMQITSALTAATAVGQAFTYTITATGSPTTFSFGATTNFPPGVTQTSVDTISGTPTQAGAFSLPLTVTNAGGGLGTATLQIGVSTVPGAPAIISNLLQTGVLAQVFSYSINATNTPTGYSARILDGPLGVTYPIPLTGVADPVTGFLISGSTISGTMKLAGTFTIELTATNALGSGTANMQAAISAVSGGPAITSRLTSTATIGTAYTYQITAINAPLGLNNFAVTSALPAGVWTLNADTGLITGAPANPAGVYPIGLKVTTPIGTASATLQLTVVSGTPTFTSATTASGTVAQAFTYTSAATGIGPITYSVSGTLPPGLTATGGDITGIPTLDGSYIVTLTATNSLGSTNQTLTITIGPAKPTLTIATALSGKVSLPFTYTLTATGSVPMTFSIIGNLPLGLSLTGAVISGTPAEAGVYPIAVTATNTLGSSTAALTLTILEKDEDSDTDGFPDEFETAFGTNASDPTSTPFGNGQSAGTIKVINVKSMSIKLFAGVTGKDSIKVIGNFEVPEGFSTAGKQVTFFVGGVIRTVTLDSKGSYKSGGDSLRISVSGMTANYTGQFTKGTFSDDLSDEGLDITQSLTGVSRQVRVIFMLNTTLYQSKKLLSFTSKANKSGSAKHVNPN